jgi:MFS family permease
MNNAEVAANTLTGFARQRYVALIAVLAAAYLGVLGAFIVAVAAPAIEADLGASRLQLQWVLLGYILPYASALVLGGRLASGQRLRVEEPGTRVSLASFGAQFFVPGELDGRSDNFV